MLSVVAFFRAFIENIYMPKKLSRIFAIACLCILSTKTTAQTPKKYKSNIDYSLDWRRISGPGLDPQCSGNCSTGVLIQTVECGVSGGQAISTGLMSLRDANSMLCSGRRIDAQDEALVERNADNIAACFKLNPNKDRYQIFIHEMLCQWKICKKNPPPNRSIEDKLGVWRQEPSGAITMTMFNRSKPGGAAPYTYIGRISEFGAELMSHNLSLCDVGRDAASAPAPAAVVLPGARLSLPAEVQPAMRPRTQQTSQ